MKLTVSSFLICSCGACLFICAKYCCFYLGSLQQGMSSFISEPSRCSKHSHSFKRATEHAMLLEGDFDKGQICVQVVCEGGGPQHHACCIDGKHKCASVCPYRPVSTHLWECPMTLCPPSSPSQGCGTLASTPEKMSLVFFNVYKKTDCF